MLGCGNILLGDDGFGPRVVEDLMNNNGLPGNVEVVNAGTSVRNLLFDVVLSEKRPRRIIIIDAIDAGVRPGEILEMSLDEIPEKKIDDFSMHQLPTSNLLKELKDICNVDVRILACQIANMPEEVSSGVSKALLEAMPAVQEKVKYLIQDR